MEAGTGRVIQVEFLTDTHRIMGNLLTGELRLTDVLNSGSLDDPLVLEGVSTTPIDDPGAVPLVRDFAQINRNAIALGVPREPSTTPEERQRLRPFEYIPKDRYEVLVSVPPFAVNGHLHLARQADVRSALSNLNQIFVPLTRARAIYTPQPKVRWSSEVIIINRRRAQIFWPPR
jgi:hypothetical protein